jgi:hypothetical protein
MIFKDFFYSKYLCKSSLNSKVWYAEQTNNQLKLVICASFKSRNMDRICLKFLPEGRYQSSDIILIKYDLMHHMLLLVKWMMNDF